MGSSFSFPPELLQLTSTVDREITKARVPDHLANMENAFIDISDDIRDIRNASINISDDIGQIRKKIIITLNLICILLSFFILDWISIHILSSTSKDVIQTCASFLFDSLSNALPANIRYHTVQLSTLLFGIPLVIVPIIVFFVCNSSPKKK